MSADRVTVEDVALAKKALADCERVLGEVLQQVEQVDAVRARLLSQRDDLRQLIQKCHEVIPVLERLL